jgi:hypothetical protein
LLCEAELSRDFCNGGSFHQEALRGLETRFVGEAGIADAKRIQGIAARAL